MAMQQGFSFESFETAFPEYQIIKQIGKGGYGVVFAVKKRTTGQTFAMKRLSQLFAMAIVGRRALREIKVLRHLRGHENIVFLHEVLRPSEPDYQELNIIQEYMPSDLSKIIHSKQPLTEDHFKYFLYQILRGLKFIHSAGIMHRDLKPSNLLINENCDLKICDFGLARGVGEGEFTQAAGFMSEYVATRWYRAPEIMFSFDGYSKAVDIWSVGCILGEMLWRKPMFPGKDYVHQLKLILAMMGTPPPHYADRIVAPSIKNFLVSLPVVRKTPLQSVFPGVSAAALDLLDKMLLWNPEERITAVQALEHPFLASYHNPADEPTCPLFDPRFENDAVEESALRQLVTKEIDFDRIRWAQLAEARKIIEEQEKKRLEEEQQRLEREQKRLEELQQNERVQQERMEQQRAYQAIVQQQQQQLLQQQLHHLQQQQLLRQQEQQTQQLLQQLQQQQMGIQVLHQPSSDAIFSTSPISISSGSIDLTNNPGNYLTFSELTSPNRIPSAPSSASWRQLMSPSKIHLQTETSFYTPEDGYKLDASTPSLPYDYSNPDWTNLKSKVFAHEEAVVNDSFMPVPTSDVVYDGPQFMDMDVVDNFLSWTVHSGLTPVDSTAYFRLLENDLAGQDRN